MLHKFHCKQKTGVLNFAVVVGGINGGPVTYPRLYCLSYGRHRETGKSHRNKRCHAFHQYWKWEDSCDGQISSLDTPSYPRHGFTSQDCDI